MNAAHLHLLINHVPIFFTFFGTLALIWFLVSPRFKEMHTAAVLLFSVGTIGTWIAVKTGGPAADIVEKLPGVTDAVIGAHADAADWAQIVAGFTGVLAVVSLAVARRRPSQIRNLSLALLLLSLYANFTLARTALLGGMVRHTEIRDLEENFIPPSPGQSNEALPTQPEAEEPLE